MPNNFLGDFNLKSLIFNFNSPLTLFVFELKITGTKYSFSTPAIFTFNFAVMFSFAVLISLTLITI